MSDVVHEIVHELIDVVSGAQAHLSPARAKELHDQLTPGYSDVPVSDDEAAAAQAIIDRRAREQAAAGA